MGESKIAKADFNLTWDLAMAYVARGLSLENAIRRAIPEVASMNWTKRVRDWDDPRSGPLDEKGRRSSFYVHMEEWSVLEVRGDEFVMGTEIREEEP